MYEWLTTATTYFHSLPLSHHYQEFKDPPTIVFSLGRQRAQHAWDQKVQFNIKQKVNKNSGMHRDIYHTN
jgi:hypothetical protein